MPSIQGASVGLLKLATANLEAVQFAVQMLTWQSDASDCGEDIEDSLGTGTITQDGCQVAISARGKTLNGTSSGDKVSGSGSFPEDGGTTYYTLDLTLSGGGASGRETCNWQDQGA